MSIHKWFRALVIFIGVTAAILLLSACNTISESNDESGYGGSSGHGGGHGGGGHGGGR